jgi:hypothetical protein
MTSKSRQLILWTACGFSLAVAVAIADDCTFTKKGGLGPCAVVGVCDSNVATYDPTTQLWHCNNAKTFPPDIYKSCVGSGTNRNDCVGNLVQCYRDTTCEAYKTQVGSPPQEVWKCRDLAPSGDWTNAEGKTTTNCKPQG